MPRLIVIIGPTAVGKTQISLNIAETFRCPIINADSRQIYRDIPIGTAAPTAEEQKRVKHFFVGKLPLDEYYSAAQYEADVMKLLPQLFQTHDNIVLTGGSMLYIDAVCKGLDNVPTVDKETRLKLKQKLQEEGLEKLVQELRLLDPAYYEACDKKNPKRVVHALEICYMTGKPFSSFHRNESKKRQFDIVKLGLQRKREDLFNRINSRVDVMMKQGWLDEARKVIQYRHCNALNTVGYKELFKYLDNEWELNFALEKIRRNTRVYAKKQMTWFKRDPEVRWFHPDEEQQILNFLDNAK